MELIILTELFPICQIADITEVDLSKPHCFLARTDEELSLVCPKDRIPAQTIQCDHNWKALRIKGELAFSLIGILANIAAVLAEAKISIYAISTYRTDYILVKADQLTNAVSALKQHGYHISEK